MEPEKNRTTKDKTVLKVVLSTLAGLVAWWWVAELCTSPYSRQLSRSHALDLGAIAGLTVFFIAWGVVAFVTRKK